MGEHQIWNELGNIYVYLGAFEQAINAYHKAVELDAGFGLAYGNLGLAYSLLQKHDEAILNYQRGIELMEDFSEKAATWNRMGNSYRIIEDKENAYLALQRAVELDPNTASYKIDLAEVSMQLAHPFTTPISSETTLEEAEKEEAIIPNNTAWPLPEDAEEPVVEANHTKPISGKSSNTEIGTDALGSDELSIWLTNLLGMPADSQTTLKLKDAEKRIIDLSKTMDIESIIDEISSAVTDHKTPDHPAENIEITTSILSDTEPEPDMVSENIQTPESVLAIEPIAGVEIEVDELRDSENEEQFPSPTNPVEQELRSTDNAILKKEQVTDEKGRAGDSENVEYQFENQLVGDDSADISLSAIEELIRKLAAEVEGLSFDLTRGKFSQPAINRNTGVTEKLINESINDEQNVVPVEYPEIYADEHSKKSRELEFREIFEPAKAPGLMSQEEKLHRTDEAAGSAYDSPVDLIDQSETGKNDRAKTDESGSALAWNELGNVFYNAGAYDEASIAYQKAIELDNTPGIALHNLALIHVHKGLYWQAAELFLKSIDYLEDDADKALAWNELGDTYRVMNEYEKAIEAYRTSDLLDPNKDPLSNHNNSGLMSKARSETIA